MRFLGGFYVYFVLLFEGIFWCVKTCQNHFPHRYALVLLLDQLAKLAIWLGKGYATGVTYSDNHPGITAESNPLVIPSKCTRFYYYSKALNKRAKYLNKWSKTCSKMRLFLMTFPPYTAHFSMHQKGIHILAVYLGTLHAYLGPSSKCSSIGSPQSRHTLAHSCVTPYTGDSST